MGMRMISIRVIGCMLSFELTWGRSLKTVVHIMQKPAESSTDKFYRNHYHSSFGGKDVSVSD